MAKIKPFAKFILIGGAVLTLLVFILLMATNGITTDGVNLKGTEVIFGKEFAWGKWKLAPLALIAWIVVLLALLVSVGTVVAEFLVKDEKIKGICELVSAIFGCLLIVAAIFMFCGKANALAANDIPSSYSGHYHLGGGWITSGIFAILAAPALACPFILNKFVK